MDVYMNPNPTLPYPILPTLPYLPYLSYPTYLPTYPTLSYMHRRRSRRWRKRGKGWRCGGGRSRSYRRRCVFCMESWGSEEVERGVTACSVRVSVALMVMM